MLRIAVCDDELQTCEEIAGYVRDYLKSRNREAAVDCYPGGKELVAAFKNQSYDIVLLDIYMEGLSGIDTARKLRATGRECDICFITISTDHALESYRLKALDYLVKPVDREAVDGFLARALKHISQSSRYITISVNHSLQRVFIKNILWVNSANHVTYLHTKQDVRKTWHTLQDYGRWLDSPPFYRISRSFLVNFDEVRRMEEEFLLMTDGSTVPLPLHHHYRQLAKEMYRDYLSRKKGKN